MEDGEEYVTGAVATVLLMLVIWCTLWLQSAPADAHDFYSPYCCSGKDCAPARVHINRDGSVTARNKFGIGRFFPKDFKPSPDGQYHACIHPTLGPRCLYVPGGV